MFGNKNRRNVEREKEEVHKHVSEGEEEVEQEVEQEQEEVPLNATSKYVLRFTVNCWNSSYSSPYMEV